MRRKLPIDPNISKNPGIIIVGRNGAGKSTLVNRIFGKIVAEVGDCSDVTTNVEKYTLKSGVEIYDTPGAGGLDGSAEMAIRELLNLDKKIRNFKPVAADVVIFLFTYERLTQQEFEFFRDVDKACGDRLIVVKNFNDKEKKGDFIRNFNDIKNRTGYNPLCVNAETGENIEEIIREIFRFLDPSKLYNFNIELEDRMRKARDLSKIFTLKMASRVTIISSPNQNIYFRELNRYQRKLKEQLIEYYLNEQLNEDIPDVLSSQLIEGFVDTKVAARGISSALGAGLGMLIGILGGPIGVGIGGIFGYFFGLSVPKSTVKGGSSAVINILSQGYGLTLIIEEALSDPGMIIAQDQNAMEKWIRSNETVIVGHLKNAEIKTKYHIRNFALKEYLDNPNIIDLPLIEGELKPVVDALFEEI